MALFEKYPGLLFVAATLLPAASFTLLLLTGFVRKAMRARKADSPGCAKLYESLGGDTPGRGAAYVATAAIGLAFVLCAVGAVHFTLDQKLKHDKEHRLHSLHHHEHGMEASKEEESEHEKLHQQIEAIDQRWQGRITWADIALNPAHVHSEAEGAGHEHEEPAKPASLLSIGYRIDNLNLVMFLMVTFIATLIHIFSMGYMAEELAPEVEDHQVHTEDGHLKRRGRFGRFFLYLSFFCFSMLNLILADNLFQVFVSWELVGICSFLLIGFYYERQSASNAANKAFITNRVGDAGFVIGLLILWTYVGSFNFTEINESLRHPFEGAHGGVDRAGQFVRADKTKDGDLRVTSGDEEGDEIVVFPLALATPHSQEEAGLHFHGLHTRDLVTVDKKWQAENPDQPQYRSMPYWLLVVAGLGIFLGCVGKSAQFPLHVWLPDAMEGPTPVSALIHAATMVAAGVYLVARAFPMFTSEVLIVIAYTGGITLFVAATIAVVQTDIKKVLAYSTVSQLGYMMLALGVGGWMAGVFHLITHAFFKALLFLCSGAVIYNCHHEQEMTKMGGLYPKMKITALTMLVGVMTIAGTPLFSGWYSKDAIVAQSLGFAVVNPQHTLLFLLPLVTAGITTFYMFRMWYLTFTGEPRDEHVHEHAHEAPRVMTYPLVILAVFSLGVAWGWPPHDSHASQLGHVIHHGQHHHVYADYGGVFDGPDQHLAGRLAGVVPTEGTVAQAAYQYTMTAELLAGLAALLGVVFATAIYYFRALDPEETKEAFPASHRFLSRKWYFDELYSAMLVRPAMAVAGWAATFDRVVIDNIVDGTGRITIWVSKWNGRFDNGIIDGLVNVIADATYGFGSRLRRVQTGYLRSYVLFLVLAAIGLFVLLSYLLAQVVAGT